MADVTFTIAIQDDGTPVIKNIKREVDGLGTSAEQAGKKASNGFGAITQSVGALGLALGAIGAAAISSQFMAMADTAKQLEGQLKLVTTGTQQLTEVQDALFQSAQRTRASYEGTVELYSRLARNAKGLGASQQDLLQVTESINKAIQVSGVSAGSANAALVQLGQAFASGTLRGEELNSIMEQTPRLSQAIAEGMGVTIGQLRALGASGKLTAEEVFNALKSQKEAIDREFGQLPITVGQALTVLNNEILRFVANADRATGASSLLAQAIQQIAKSAAMVAEALRANTMEEKFRSMTKEATALETEIARIQGLPSFASWLEKDNLARAQERLAQLNTSLKETSTIMKGRVIDPSALRAVSDGVFLTAGAFDKLGEHLKALTPEQEKFKAAMDKTLAGLKDQAAQGSMTAKAYIDYQAAQLAASGQSAEQVAQWKSLSLQILAQKEALTAAAKAKQDDAKASRESAKAEKELEKEKEKAAETLRDIAALTKKITNEKIELDKKEFEASYEALQQQMEALKVAAEENDLLAASMGPRENLLEVEKNIALARAERAKQTQLAAVAEGDLKDVQQSVINATAEQTKRNIELAKSQEQSRLALEKAILTTNDAKAAFEDMLVDAFDDPKKALDHIEDLGKELGGKLIAGVAFGKQGLEDNVLIPNFSDIFGPGGIVGSIMGQSGLNLGSLFGSSLSQGVSGTMGSGGILSSIMEKGGAFLGKLFGSSAGSAATTEWQAAVGGINGSGFSFGPTSGAGGGMGGLFTLGGGLLGMWGGNKLAGLAGLTGSKSGKMGGSIGGIAGGIAGGALATGGMAAGGILAGLGLGATMGSIVPVIGTAIGAIIGTLLGAFAGNLFKPTTTSGTLIRKGVKEYLKDIEASFADEIDSGQYFFGATKKLADKMYGGDFLKASKDILTQKAGPELAKQLQALGTVLTADSAKKLDKSLEQTGTTFGNMLVDNLGIDEIPAALDEIVGKSKLSLEGMVETLNKVFEQDRISEPFYKDAIMGSVALFTDDLPAAIHASELALQSFDENGIFVLEKFQGLVEAAMVQVEAFSSAFGQALSEGIASGQTRDQVEAAFETLFRDALRGALIQKFVAEALDDILEGVDFSKPIDLSSEAFAQLKEKVGDAYDGLMAVLDAAGLLPETLQESVNSADDLVAKIRELQAEIQEIANQRIELRLQLLDDFVSIGLITALDAIADRIQTIQDRITGVFDAALYDAPGRRPDRTAALSELSDTDLENLIALQGQLREAILARYQEEASAIQAAAQAQLAAIREEYAAKRAAIQADIAARREAIQADFNARREALRADFDARREAIREEYDGRREAIREEFDARREAVQETIDMLQSQREATQELYQEQIQGLEDQLRIAEQFGDIVQSITEMIRAAALSAQSPLAPQQQLGFLQREEAGIRGQLSTATGAERVRLTQELAQILQQQLQFVDRNTANGQQLFRGILAELSTLRDEAAAEADKAAELQARIAAATLAMEAALLSIDEQIQEQQDLLSTLSEQEQSQLEALSKQEQAQLDALSQQEQAQLEALSQQEQAQLDALAAEETALLTALAAEEAAAILAVETAATAQLEALRQETAQELTALAVQQDLAHQEQQRRLEEQLATAKEQLIAQVGAEEAARLLAAGDEAHLILLAQANVTLHQINDNILAALGNNEENNSELAPTIGPTSQSIQGGNASPVVVNFSYAPVVTVHAEGGEQTTKNSVDETMRASEQRIKRLMETDWAPTIRRVAEGKL